MRYIAFIILISLFSCSKKEVEKEQLKQALSESFNHLQIQTIDLIFESKEKVNQRGNKPGDIRYHKLANDIHLIAENFLVQIDEDYKNGLVKEYIDSLKSIVKNTTSDKALMKIIENSPLNQYQTNNLIKSELILMQLEYDVLFLDFEIVNYLYQSLDSYDFRFDQVQVLCCTRK